MKRKTTTLAQLLAQAEREQGPRELAAQCRMAGMAEPVREFVFDAVRGWRFDLAWPELHAAVECDGGIFTGGRHVRGKGFLGDMEKLNAATLQGWRVIRCTPQMVRRGEALGLVERLVGG